METSSACAIYVHRDEIGPGGRKSQVFLRGRLGGHGACARPFKRNAQQSGEIHMQLLTYGTKNMQWGGGVFCDQGISSIIKMKLDNREWKGEILSQKR